jgi:hypothetical protein
MSQKREPEKATPTEDATDREATLAEFVGCLKDGPRSLIPHREDWSDLIRRISTPEVVCEIDRETYDYFLDVLPPRWLNGRRFAYGEGADFLRLFWTVGGRFFSRQLTAVEHRTFCRLAGIGFTSG